MVQETEATVVTEETPAPEATKQEETPPVEDSPVAEVPEEKPDSDTAPTQDEVTEDSLREQHSGIFSELDSRQDEATTKARKDGNAQAQTRLTTMLQRHNQSLEISRQALTQGIPTALKEMAEKADWSKGDVNDLLNGFQNDLGGMFQLSIEQGRTKGIADMISSTLTDADQDEVKGWVDRFSAVTGGADTHEAIMADFLDEHAEKARKEERAKWETKYKALEGKVAAGSAANRQDKGANISTSDAGGGSSGPLTKEDAENLDINVLRERRAREKA